MRKVLGLSLLLVVALTAMASGKPVDMSSTSLRAEQANQQFERSRLSGGLALENAHIFVDTTTYGGTYWAADSLRWEAVKDSQWTFDTGVGSAFGNTGPNKPAGYHTLMEGWYGIDQTLNPLPYFRRVTECAISGSSFWAGATLAEANSMCWAGGRGYGNGWNMVISKSYSYTGGATTYAYDYAIECEPGFDYSYALVDTSGNGSAADIVLSTYTGNVAGHAALNLVVGSTLPTGATVGSPKTVKFKFQITSDGGYSDEDGNYPTNCGHSVYDNVAVGAALGGTTDNFDASAGGWAEEVPTTGIGDYTNIVNRNTDLPPPVTFCPCGLRDSVLVFYDLLSQHPIDQDNIAASPWIDLKRTNDFGRPGKLMLYDVYAEMPLANYVFVNLRVRYYPAICAATGLIYKTPWKDQNIIFYFGESPFCNPFNAPRLRDYSAVVDAAAEQLQLGFGMLNLCRTAPFGVPCTHVTNTTPWMDNIGLGVYGPKTAPSVSILTFDVYQDNFASDGTLNPASTVAVDTNRLKGFSTPSPGSALADTLVVGGDGGNTEVRLFFKIRPGPFTSVANLNAYGAAHYWKDESGRIGAGWKSCRMDSAEQGGTKKAATWMGTVHEDEEGNPTPGTLTGGDRRADPANPNQLYWEIIPDHILTPGSRIDYFVAARYRDARNPGGPNGDLLTSWYVLPDTTHSNFLEWEALPTSMAADTSWNCTLYVDHHGDRDFFGQQLEENGLKTYFGPGGNSPEGQKYDRFDNQTPSSGQLSLGRPIQTTYGASILQIFAYKNIAWHCGDLSSLQLTQEDANIVGPWLSLRAVGNNRFWGSGDGFPTSMNGSGQPSAVNFMKSTLGVLRTCNTLRDVNCPTGTVLDSTYCAPTSNVAGAEFTTTLPARVRGNGCPQLRSFDLINVNGSVASAKGQLNYVKSGVDRPYASVTNHNTIDVDFKTVTDGFAVGQLRSNNGFFFFGCNNTTAATQRSVDVMTWFGSATNCKTPAGLVGVPGGETPKPPQFRYALGNAYPNPMNPTTRIAFTNGVEGGKVRLAIFDVTGRLVKTLVDGTMTAGPHDVVWDGTTDNGNHAPSGMYFYKMSASNFVQAKKLVMMK